MRECVRVCTRALTGGNCCELFLMVLVMFYPFFPRHKNLPELNTVYNYTYIVVVVVMVKVAVILPVLVTFSSLFLVLLLSLLS